MNPDGIVSVDLKSSGTVPDFEGLDPYNLPVSVLCKIKLKDVQGLFQGHRVAGANGTVMLAHGHGDTTRVSVTTDLHVASVDFAPGLPLQRASGVFADLALTAEQFDDLSIRKVRLGMEGLEVWLSGSIGGLRGLVEEMGRPTEKTIGPVFVKLQSKVGVQVDQFPDLLKPYGVEGSGRTEVALSVLKKERGPLDVRLRLENQKVSVTQEGTRLVNLNGPIVVRKVFDWIPSHDGEKPKQVFTPTVRLPQLRAVALTQQDLNVDEVDLGTLTISKLTGGITFDRNQLLVQNLSMNILGGGLGGNLVLTSGKAFGLTTRLEAAQLDLNALLEPDRQPSGDSVVDGLVDLTAFFDPDTGKVDLGQTHMDLSITRVGKDALDRLLVFIDPDGSNPSIVGARSAVALANPGTVRVTLRKGMLSLKIRFQDGLLSSFEMDRIPVGRVRHLQEVTERIPQWATIRDTMALLGDSRYGFDQDGAILIE